MESMNQTPSGERVHIGFFGRRNAGKSSLVNAVTNQRLAVVSDVAGTTTDPVSKAMEILPLGPVVVTDTPGFDDEGSLGELRVEQTRRILAKTDIAVLVVDSIEGIMQCDIELAELFAERRIPYVLVLNKSDLSDDYVPTALETLGEELTGPLSPAAVLDASAKTGEGIEDLKNAIAAIKPDEEGLPIIKDKISKGDIVLLVVPIDEAAPKGRLILPQQQTIRDILDAGASAVVVKDTELKEMLAKLEGPARPSLVITDSQVFGKVRDTLPEDMMLTSFSILMARHKGLLAEAVRGIAAIESLKDGDRILIAEGCTHHRQCGDIGSVKIPKWLSDYTKKELIYETVSGTEYPSDLTDYALVIHCGGCMLNEKEVAHRTKEAASQGVPITNYGTLIAHLNGILKRSLEIFPEYKIQ